MKSILFENNRVDLAYDIIKQDPSLSEGQVVDALLAKTKDNWGCFAFLVPRFLKSRIESATKKALQAAQGFAALQKWEKTGKPGSIEERFKTHLGDAHLSASKMAACWTGFILRDPEAKLQNKYRQILKEHEEGIQQKAEKVQDWTLLQMLRLRNNPKHPCYTCTTPDSFIAVLKEQEPIIYDNILKGNEDLFKEKIDFEMGPNLLDRSYNDIPSSVFEKRFLSSPEKIHRTLQFVRKLKFIRLQKNIYATLKSFGLSHEEMVRLYDASESEITQRAPNIGRLSFLKRLEETLKGLATCIHACTNVFGSLDDNQNAKRILAYLDNPRPDDAAIRKEIYELASNMRDKMQWLPEGFKESAFYKCLPRHFQSLYERREEIDRIASEFAKEEFRKLVQNPNNSQTVEIDLKKDFSLITQDINGKPHYKPYIFEKESSRPFSAMTLSTSTRTETFNFNSNKESIDSSGQTETVKARKERIVSVLEKLSKDRNDDFHFMLEILVSPQHELGGSGIFALAWNQKMNSSKFITETCLQNKIIDISENRISVAYHFNVKLCEAEHYIPGDTNVVPLDQQAVSIKYDYSKDESGAWTISEPVWNCEASQIANALDPSHPEFAEVDQALMQDDSAQREILARQDGDVISG